MRIASGLLSGCLLLAAPAGSWPTDAPSIVARFRAPDEAWAAGHRGIDLAARTGDPVYAMAAGTVAFVGDIAGKPVVTVAHPGEDRLRSTYEPVLTQVRVGQRVSARELIGIVAATGGHCGGVAGCVHVGLRTDVRYVDPMILIGRRPAVLKPVGHG